MKLFLANNMRNWILCCCCCCYCCSMCIVYVCVSFKQNNMQTISEHDSNVDINKYPTSNWSIYSSIEQTNIQTDQMFIPFARTLLIIHVIISNVYEMSINNLQAIKVVWYKQLSYQPLPSLPLPLYTPRFMLKIQFHQWKYGQKWKRKRDSVENTSKNISLFTYTVIFMHEIFIKNESNWTH